MSKLVAQYMQTISLWPINYIISGYFPISGAQTLRKSSAALSEVSCFTRLKRPISQNTVAGSLRGSVTVGTRQKGCLEKLKHQAFSTHSRRRCVTCGSHKENKAKNKREGEIEHNTWLVKWESLSRTPLSEWMIKISNMMLEAAAADWWRLDKAPLLARPHALISFLLASCWVWGGGWVYLFKALKGVEGTCINHNYFTHAKISQRVRNVVSFREQHGKAEGKGERGKERAELNR